MSTGKRAGATQADVILIGVGIVYTSVCVPAELPVSDVVAAVDSLAPTGLSHGWSIARDDHFATGHAHPCPCEKIEGRVHRLLEC